jgi:hypothetical protein
VKLPPPDDSATTLLRPATACGCTEGAPALPVPSSPFTLPPKQATVASALSTQVWLAPATTETTPATPAAAKGSGLLADERLAASPSWPSLLSPQQRSVPLDSCAHACSAPAARPTMPASPLTATGAAWLATAPLPSTPKLP